MEHNYAETVYRPKSILALKIEAICHTPVLDVVSEPPVLTPIGEGIRKLLSQGREVRFQHVYIEHDNREHHEALHELGHSWVEALWQRYNEKP